jgi:hypothetical protein
MSICESISNHNELLVQGDEEPVKEIILNDIWTLYFHDPYNEDWNYPSYHKICDRTSVDEFWQLQNIVKDKIHCGMFFFMREYVFPCWDDENNKNGGCLSLKVLKQDMSDFWEELCIRLLGETLLKEEHRHNWNLVNGISTSPKKYFCIIKIWIKSSDIADPNMFDLPDKYHGEVLFRSNQENIDNDHQKSQGQVSNSPNDKITYR